MEQLQKQVKRKAQEISRCKSRGEKIGRWSHLVIARAASIQKSCEGSVVALVFVGL